MAVPNVDTGTATVIGIIVGIILDRFFFPKIWTKILKPLVGKIRAKIGS